MSRIAGIVLAGGRSSRMGGGDKCLFELGGLSLIERVASRFAPQVDALAISTGDHVEKPHGLHYPTLADAVPGGVGPLAGLLAGLEWATVGGFDWLISVPCDVPFLPRDLATRLYDAVADKELSLASSGERVHHVIGLWPVEIGERLRRGITEDGLHEVRAFTRSLAFETTAWPSHPYDPFHNINRPEDLEVAARILEKFDP